MSRQASNTSEAWFAFSLPASPVAAATCLDEDMVPAATWVKEEVFLDAVLTDVLDLGVLPADVDHQNGVMLPSTEHQGTAHAQAQAYSAEQSFEHMQDTLGLMNDVPDPRNRPGSEPYADLHQLPAARGMKKHWMREVVDMRRQCTQRGLDGCAELRHQLEFSQAAKHQAQKESLLRFLHVSRADGLILVLGDCAQQQPPNRWAGFRVIEGSQDDFFSRLVDLFGMSPNDMRVNAKSWRALNAAWGRLGFKTSGSKGKHDIWAMAYRGLLDFVLAE